MAESSVNGTGPPDALVSVWGFGRGCPEPGVARIRDANRREGAAPQGRTAARYCGPLPRAGRNGTGHSGRREQEATAGGKDTCSAPHARPRITPVLLHSRNRKAACECNRTRGYRWAIPLIFRPYATGRVREEGCLAARKYVRLPEKYAGGRASPRANEKHAEHYIPCDVLSDSHEVTGRKPSQGM